MDLNTIPRDCVKLPEGISERSFETKAEMDAFLDGLGYVGDIDVSWGDPFLRGDELVVRIQVGDACPHEDWDEYIEEGA